MNYPCGRKADCVFGTGIGDPGTLSLVVRAIIKNYLATGFSNITA
jgi:hypothetical protein